MDKKSTKDLMQITDLNNTMDHMAKAYCVRWYGHVLRKVKNNVFRRDLYLEVKVTRERGRVKKTRLMAVVEQSRNVGLNESDANIRSSWRLGVIAISCKKR